MSKELLGLDNAIKLPIGLDSGRLAIRLGQIFHVTIQAILRSLARQGRAVCDEVLISLEDLGRSSKAEDHEKACSFRKTTKLRRGSVVTRVVSVSHAKNGANTASGACTCPGWLVYCFDKALLSIGGTYNSPAEDTSDTRSLWLCVVCGFQTILCGRSKITRLKNISNEETVSSIFFQSKQRPVSQGRQSFGWGTQASHLAEISATNSSPFMKRTA